jgi:hypothetical protein
VIGNAAQVMRIATGEIADDVPSPESEGKAAVALDASDGGGSDGQARGHDGCCATDLCYHNACDSLAAFEANHAG